MDNAGGNTCACNIGFAPLGNECVSVQDAPCDICQNYGVCTQTAAAATECTCVLGFSGDYCEVNPPTAIDADPRGDEVYIPEPDTLPTGRLAVRANFRWNGFNGCTLSRSALQRAVAQLADTEGVMPKHVLLTRLFISDCDLEGGSTVAARRLLQTDDREIYLSIVVTAPAGTDKQELRAKLGDAAALGALLAAEDSSGASDTLIDGESGVAQPVYSTEDGKDCVLEDQYLNGPCRDDNTYLRSYFIKSPAGPGGQCAYQQELECKSTSAETIVTVLLLIVVLAVILGCTFVWYIRKQCGAPQQEIAQRTQKEMAGESDTDGVTGELEMTKLSGSEVEDGSKPTDGRKVRLFWLSYSSYCVFRLT